jgi:hypothetical protein
MTAGERLRRYLERQLELLASYGELQGKIEQSVQAGQTDLLAAQALEARRLATECSELHRAARQLAKAGGKVPRELEARLAAQAALSGALRELAARIRDLAARPRTPPSPFTRIGRPMLVDLRS